MDQRGKRAWRRRATVLGLPLGDSPDSPRCPENVTRVTSSSQRCDKLGENALTLTYEKAALRWLERHLAEGSPRLRHFAEVTARLAERQRQP
jgi:hypothetical protein